MLEKICARMRLMLPSDYITHSNLVVTSDGVFPCRHSDVTHTPTGNESFRKRESVVLLPVYFSVSASDSSALNYTPE